MYKVKITPFALSQLQETVDYISEVLLVPETAEKWLNVLQSEIAGLCELPNRHPLCDKEPWKTNGVRKMPVKGFIVYYFVNENTNTVFVTAVVYGRRDQLAALKEMDD